MKKLQELIWIVSPLKLRHIEVLGKGESLADELYNLIQSKKVNSDQEALELLYRGSNSKSALYQLKEKLYNKLIDALLIIDTSEKGYSESNIKKIQCLRICTALELLVQKGAYNNIFVLAEKTIKISIEYEFIESTLRLAKLLRRLYGIVHGNQKKFEYYSEIFDKFSEMRRIEDISEFYWSKISLHFSKKRMVIDNDLISMTKEYATILEKALERPHSTISFIYYCMLKLRALELENDFERVVSYSNQFIKRLKTYKYYQAGFFNALLSKKLTALITLRKYSLAEQTITENLKFVRKGLKIWFTLMESILILSFYKQEYKKAYLYYIEVINVDNFNLLRDSRKEIWIIYRAYLQFFTNIDELEIDSKAESKNKFRYKKFLNEVPIFSKDKTGINITIIVAQFLILFSEKRYNEAIDRIESVKKYVRSHLRKDATFRSQCFLKMLVKLVECSYHKTATMRKTKDLYAKLKNHPPNIQRQSSHVEIVPFEDLWQIILDSIDNTIKKRKKKKVE